MITREDVGRLRESWLIDLLRKQSKEVAKARINGWGNTMSIAADHLERLQFILDALVEAGHVSRQKVDEAFALADTIKEPKA